MLERERDGAEEKGEEEEAALAMAFRPRRNEVVSGWSVASDARRRILANTRACSASAPIVREDRDKLL